MDAVEIVIVNIYGIYGNNKTYNGKLVIARGMTRREKTVLEVFKIDIMVMRINVPKIKKMSHIDIV